MSEKHVTLINSLVQIRRDLPQLNSADREKLIKVGVALEEILMGLPEDFTEAGEVLTWCLVGLQNIYQEQISDIAGFARVMETALVAIQQILSAPDNPLSSEMVRRASKVIQTKLDEYSLPASSSAENSDIAESLRAEEFELNDAAALLVQLDATDREGLLKLRRMLTDLIASLPESTQEIIRTTVTLIDQVIEGNTGDANKFLLEAGRHLERAMEIVEELACYSERTAVAHSSRTGSETASGSDETVSRPADKNITPVAPTLDQSVPAENPAPVLTTQTGFEEAVFAPLPADADAGLLGDYIAEGREYIESAEAALLQLESGPDNLEAVNLVFRAFHTIKGTSGFIGIVPISQLAHRAESLLSRARDREITLTGAYADLALRSIDMLKALLQAVQDAVEGNQFRKPDGYDLLMFHLVSPETSVSPAPKVVTASTLAPSVLASTEIGTPGTSNEKSELIEPTQVSAPRTEPASSSPVQRQNSVNSIGSTSETSVRIRTDRMDRLIDLVGELVIAQSMVAQDQDVVNGLHHELTRKVTHAGKIVRELQDLSMAMRMVPLRGPFQKMARLVRDLSQKNGKKVDLITEGEDTEIDRHMVDALSDPLVHMIRNSVDHGIELPEDRMKNGKPPSGTLRLAAYHAGGNVVVEIQDDGRGLCRERILKKALEKGLIDNDKLTDSQVWNLIFLPGFSTAEKVTDVSGRGVGMDVVKRYVDALRGRIEISSEVGQGTIFTIRLPLTLAITDGMLIKVGAERYIIPTIGIHLSFRPVAEQLSTVAGRGEMVLLRGELMPIFRLHRLFDIPNAIEEPTQSLLVIVADGRRRCALLVDELLGQQQVVVKTLGAGIGKVKGVSGGAILGDGRVGLILDPAEIISLVRASSGPEHRRLASLHASARG